MDQLAVVIIINIIYCGYIIKHCKRRDPEETNNTLAKENKMKQDSNQPTMRALLTRPDPVSDFFNYLNLTRTCFFSDPFHL